MFSPPSVLIIPQRCCFFSFFYNIPLSGMIGLEVQQGDFSSFPLWCLAQTWEFELQIHEKRFHNWSRETLIIALTTKLLYCKGERTDFRFESLNTGFR